MADWLFGSRVITFPLSVLWREFHRNDLREFHRNDLRVEFADALAVSSQKNVICLLRVSCQINYFVIISQHVTGSCGPMVRMPSCE